MNKYSALDYLYDQVNLNIESHTRKREVALKINDTASINKNEGAIQALTLLSKQIDFLKGGWFA
jgi:hypothetical protein